QVRRQVKEELSDLLHRWILRMTQTRAPLVENMTLFWHGHFATSAEKVHQPCSDLKAKGIFDRVLVMTFSEIGRRVAENASKGTDHGTAAPMFVAGGAIRPGLYGKQPGLDLLDDGDLVYHTDFRSVYATVLANWMKAPAPRILGRDF